ncbi:toll/interleukin-1 receptor domain-containing protein [Anoxybacillus rupiensis]|jgi:TIR domain|uniref:Toll/interleukin-1 receptor domain-containing protein n=1 Tax=Anoxybacteroides rupiense TaxID=311460 RepID=A0ABT5W8S3_9BACL|nr:MULTISPECIES: toll/interleukin-1 receptor domain-containing protein [Anoxybacillus]MDE8565726.1 toll/interleukin-1 receptor domain-containing protein [Anoxybacillus rupiensis]QHC03314.1 TIR domain-containing protein [Anoxybacillus sp. PDR2]
MKSYVFSLSYAERTKEKEFIKDILRRYDTNQLVGAGIYVSNNPYNFQLLLHLNFSIDTAEFENWLNENYPDKKRRFNYFHTDIFEAMPSKGYNIATFIDEDSVDEVIVSNSNHIFLFPEKSELNKIWDSDVLKEDFTIFLSHSSKDKPLVDVIFNKLQVHEIKAWYDKYEIQLGDSIVDKINEGLENSDLGIICISKNFLNSSTGWTKSELNYFIQRRMRSGKVDFICLNFDVEHSDLPPLVQEYRYIDMRENDSLDILIDTLKERIGRSRNMLQ